MNDSVELLVNGLPVSVPTGATVATAVAVAGVSRFRKSVFGQPRSPVCGMGVCMECRVTINGKMQSRSCQTICEPGMEVCTDA